MSSSNPVNVSAAAEPIHFFGENRALYFYVPAGTKDFGVKVFGRDADDGVKAALYTPSGKLYGEQDDITQAHQFEVSLPAPSAGDIWSLKLSKASHVYLQDNYVELLGLPPYLATSPEAILAPAK
jgi:hypothetical protein